MQQLRDILTTTLTQLAANPAIVATGIIIAIAIIATLTVLAWIRFSAATKTIWQKITGNIALACAAGAALLATGMSAEGMWRFVGDQLMIVDTTTRLVFFAFFEILMFASAVGSRRYRLRLARKSAEDPSSPPPSIGADGIAVWVIAVMIGYFAATEMDSTPAQIARFIVPLAAAWMWERALVGELAEATKIDPAIVKTSLTRVFSMFSRAGKRVIASLHRMLARLGVVAPTGQTAIEAMEARWIRKLTKTFIKIQSGHTKSAAAYQRQIMRANALGVLVDDASQARLQRAIARIDQSVRAIDRSVLVSIDPWRINQLTDRPTDRPKRSIKTIDQNDRPTNRESTDRPITKDTDQSTTPTDRPIKPIDRSIDQPKHDDRPADTDQSTDQNDRPTTRKRRTKEENEKLILAALAAHLGEHEKVALPSDAQLAATATVSKSTVNAYISRNSLRGTTITKNTINQLTK